MQKWLLLLRTISFAHASLYIMVPFHISWEQLPGMSNQTTARKKERRLSLLKALSLVSPQSETPVSVKQSSCPEDISLPLERAVGQAGGRAVPGAAEAGSHPSGLLEAEVQLPWLSTGSVSAASKKRIWVHTLPRQLSPLFVYLFGGAGLHATENWQ